MTFSFLSERKPKEVSADSRVMSANLDFLPKTEFFLEVGRGQARSQTFKKRGGDAIFAGQGCDSTLLPIKTRLLAYLRVGKLFQQSIILEKWVTIGGANAPNAPPLATDQAVLSSFFAKRKSPPSQVPS